MADSPVLSTFALPPDLDAEEVLGLHAQIGARIAALLRPKGRKSSAGELALPAGVEPLDALPPHIEKPWRRFDAAAKALEAFRTSRASAQADAAHTTATLSEQDAANAGADDRWRAFEAWNKGAATLADDGKAPAPAEARWLYSQIFPAPDGLRFITRRPRVQWAAMVQRMTVLEGERAHAAIKGFGGTRHMEQLAHAHARFGKAYGFTAAVIQPEIGPTDGRPQWVTAREALRTLMQRIEGYGDPDIEASEPLAAFLLGPYVEMVNDLEKSRRAGRARKPEAAATAAQGGDTGDQG